MESLEDRTLLSVNPIDFSTPEVYTYSSGGAEVRIDLEKADFFQFIDIDDDGTQDLVASFTNMGNDQFYFYKGSSTSGVFAAPVEIGEPGAMKSSFNEIYTYNGERYLVSLSGSAKVPLRIFKITTVAGKPSLGSPTEISLDFKNLGMYSNPGPYTVDTPEITGIQIVDVTGDKTPDFVFSLKVTFWNDNNSTSETKQAVAFLKGTGSGTFSATAVELKNGSSSITGDILGIGAFSGNASDKLQLITLESNTNKFNVYNATSLSDSTSFVFKTSYTNSDFDIKSYCGNLRLGDSFAMGKLSSSSKSMAVIGAVSGTQGYGAMIIGMSSTYQLSSSFVALGIAPVFISVGRILNDNSSQEDIFVSNGAQYQVLSWNATLSKYVASDPVSASANYYMSAIGDFDKNGVSDLLAIGETQVTFFSGGDMNNPRTLLTFQSFSSSSLDYTARAVVADFNGDGIDDIAIITGQPGSTVQIYAGSVSSDGNPVFSLVTSIENTQPKMLFNGNFTENYANSSTKTKADLLVFGGHTDKYTYVYKFGLDWKISTVNEQPIKSALVGDIDKVSIAIADICGNSITAKPDGLDDLVIADYYKSTVTVLRNSAASTGSFTSTGVSIQVGKANISHTCDIAVADFDGDGLLDIVALNKDATLNDSTGTGEIVILRQKTQGDFRTDNSYYTVGGNPTRLAIGNFDGDAAGLPDILVGPNGNAASTDPAKSKTAFTVFANTSGPTSGISFVSGDKCLLETGAFSSIELLNIGVSAGKVDSNSSIDVVITCGNQVRLMRNNNMTSSDLATTMLVYRDLSVTTFGDDTADLSTLGGQLTWVDEWSSFYIEVWAKTDANNEITAFTDCLITYDTNLFKVDTSGSKIASGFSSVNIDTSMAGKIVLAGTGGNGKASSTDAFTLLGRILLRPNEKGGGVKAPKEGYDTSVSAGIDLASGMIVTTAGGIGGAVPGSYSKLSVYPVVYDVDDNGIINLSDISAMIRKYGVDVDKDKDAQRFDFNMSGGKINLSDVSLMIRSFGKSLAKSQTVTNTSRYINYDSKLVESWNSASKASLLSAMAALDIEIPEEVLFALEITEAEQVSASQGVEAAFIPVPATASSFDSADIIELENPVLNSDPAIEVATGFAPSGTSGYEFRPSSKIGEYDTLFGEGFVRGESAGVRVEFHEISDVSDLALAAIVEEDAGENLFANDYLLEDLIASF